MKTLRRLFPITLNTLILLLASGYCLSLISKTDLLATIFAWALIGTIAIVTIMVLVNFIVLRRKLIIHPLRSGKTSVHYLDRPAYLKLEIEHLQIFPLCQVSLTVNFHHSTFTPAALILKTKEKTLTAEYQIEFPHHANWQIKNIEYSVSDLFGLTKISGLKEGAEYPVVKVEPARCFSPELPLVFSTLTAGDVINIPQKKMGDYYDLKKYHPGDGISKVVWKIFARSQELIARHPEDTALPAGKSLVFLLGDKDSPELSRHCLNYLDQISKKDLEFIFDCSGKFPAIYNDLTAAAELVLANVWSAEARRPEDNASKLNLLFSKEKSCLEIAIFMDENNPAKKRILALCKSKGVKVLLITTKKTYQPASKLNKFLFYNSNNQVSSGTAKIISKYV